MAALTPQLYYFQMITVWIIQQVKMRLSACRVSWLKYMRKFPDIGKMGPLNINLCGSWMLTFTVEYFISAMRHSTMDPTLGTFTLILNLLDKTHEVTEPGVELTAFFRVLVSRGRQSGKLPSRRREMGHFWQRLICTLMSVSITCEGSGSASAIHPDAR